MSIRLELCPGCFYVLSSVRYFSSLYLFFEFGLDYVTSVSG